MSLEEQYVMLLCQCLSNLGLERKGEILEASRTKYCSCVSNMSLEEQYVMLLCQSFSNLESRQRVRYWIYVSRTAVYDAPLPVSL